MILETKILNKDVKISEFILEDFRTISFLNENKSTKELYNLLTRNLDNYNGMEKFTALLKLRIMTVNENVNFYVNEKNISVNLNIWYNNLIKNIQDIKTTLNIDDIEIELNYPKEFYYEKMDELFTGCIYNIKYKNNELNFESLSLEEKMKVLDNLPSRVIVEIQEFIENYSTDYMLMNSRLGISDIIVNFFNNSAFDIIQNIYNYYNYDDILELLFNLSKRVPDIQYLNSRNPRDIEFLIKLYSEDIEKTVSETKSIL